MKRILTNDIKKLGETKFARWRAIFSNLDFDIEHIKAVTNCIPDFLSRENLQGLTHLMLIVAKWDVQHNQEIYREIPDST